MYSNNQLKLIYSITKALNNINHPNSYIIAKEIIEFTQDSNKITKIISRLRKEEPWEYIRGYTYFKNNKILVNNSTLIPRIETEQLVDIAIKKIDNDTQQIIEVGSGTGAIIISIQKELKKLQKNNIKLIAIEYYDNAIKLLKNNLKLNKIDNIQVIKSDILKNISDINTNLKTIIVANLPYISEDEYIQLQPSVKYYEPKSALIGGKNGSELILELLNQSKIFNIQSILLEVSESTSKYILKKYQDAKIVKDMFDKDRFIVI